MILGVIADDFTGASDVASMLVRAGMSTVQVLGVPAADAILPQADALVIALKTRTINPQEAVAESLAACAVLKAAGARQIYFKYCSTFDSTPQGNIGPVAQALMEALGAKITIACPAFPENGRTVFKGYLFVGDQLLHESGMRHHPLTPMTDAHLVRVLQAQTSHKVGLLTHDVVDAGVAVVQAKLHALQQDGVRMVVADAIHNAHLLTLADAVADAPFITAGSGVALGLPAAYERRGWLQPHAQAAALDSVGGAAAIISGSCSQATQTQVARWQAAHGAAIAVDPLALHRGDQKISDLIATAVDLLALGPILIYATADADQVQKVQQVLGLEAASGLVEDGLAAVAQGLVEAGVRRLVVAGGETSGAVVKALGVQVLRIGAPICPGVPWTQTTWRNEPLLLALKSGNFGGPDFFAQALTQVGVTGVTHISPPSPPRKEPS